MKHFRLILLVLLSSMVVISSCKKEDDEPDDPVTGSPVVSWEGLKLGSFNDAAYGHFMNTTGGKVMSTSEATAEQASVDIAFYYGANNGPTFAAPSNSIIIDIYGLMESDWTVFNTTLFQKADIDSETFDAISDRYEFPEFTGERDEITHLIQGDVVFFRTVNEKSGYLRINALNQKGDVVEVDVKVMQ